MIGYSGERGIKVAVWKRKTLAFVQEGVDDGPVTPRMGLCWGTVGGRATSFMRAVGLVCTRRRPVWRIALVDAH